MTRFRVWRGAILAVLMLGASGAMGLEFRDDPNRAGIVLVGDPVLLTYEQLTREMDNNIELREWIEAYGRPDYAEAQRTEIDEPFFPYEVHLYYLDGNRHAIFGRVHVSPSLLNFGTRKYVGRIGPEELDRLLTAESMAPEHAAYDVDTMEAPAAMDTSSEIFAPESEAAAEPEDVEIIVAPATAPEAVAPPAEVETADAAVQVEAPAAEVDVEAPAADVEVEAPAADDAD